MGTSRIHGHGLIARYFCFLSDFRMVLAGTFAEKR